VLEQYSFSPTEMFSRVTINDYLLFLVYALEYRALVMEQMSHEEEVKYLESHPGAADRTDGYGMVLLNFCIRDLNGEFEYLFCVVDVRKECCTELLILCGHYASPISFDFS